MDSLHIYNTLSRQKEIFTPIIPQKVGFYSCGPTVYNYVHLGNCRSFVVMDLMRRYLMYLGYQVRFVRNITDVGHLENDADEGEDKIAKKAKLDQLEPMEVVQKYVLYFHDILRQLNVLPPSIEPTATGHLIEQIEMIKKIIAAGFAYESNGSVYFDIQKYSEKYPYGELSGRKKEELLEVTRTLKNTEEKKHPNDFALWKKADQRHIMHWPSPWGEGFPGWHIECSAMSTKYLGAQFDIHGGGMDLQFPHHECEIAQGKAANGKQAARFWVHNNMLLINGQRMSKSAGNFITPDALFRGSEVLGQAFSPYVLRLFLLHAHYRSVLDLSKNALEAMETIEKKIQRAYAILQNLPIYPQNQTADLAQKWRKNAEKALNDDFNTVLLLVEIQEWSKMIFQWEKEKKALSEKEKKDLLSCMEDFWEKVLGLSLATPIQNTAENEKIWLDFLLDLRENAKKQKNFALADQIRDSFKKAGLQIKDTPEGAKIEKI